MECFCSDNDATKTTEILVLNRKTVNRHFRIFRGAIFEKQQRDLSLFFGEVELGEAYKVAKCKTCPKNGGGDFKKGGPWEGES